MASLFRVRTVMAGGSGAAQISTMYFLNDGTLTAQNAATAVRTFWDSIKGRINVGYVMSSEGFVESIDTTTGSPTGITPVTIASVTGTDAGDPLPWQTQGLVSWQTGVFSSGRQIRGRTFIPGTTEPWSTAGVPAALYLSVVDAAATALIGDVLSELVVYSRTHAAYAQVSTGKTWTKWAGLRSRRD